MKFHIAAISSVLSIIYVCSLCNGDVTRWKANVDGDWFDASKWSNGVPTSGVDAYLDEHCTITIADRKSAYVSLLAIDSDSPSGQSASHLIVDRAKLYADDVYVAYTDDWDGQLTLTNYAMLDTNRFTLSYSAEAILNVNSGSYATCNHFNASKFIDGKSIINLSGEESEIIVNNHATFGYHLDNSSTGIFNISSGATFKSKGISEFELGNYTVNLSTGGIFATDSLSLVSNGTTFNGSTGYLRFNELTQAPNTLTFNTNVQLGDYDGSSTALLTLDSGKNYTFNHDFTVGYNKQATLNLTGGHLAVTDKLRVADKHEATVNQSAGYASAKTISIATNHRDGTYNLTGGSLTADNIYIGGNDIYYGHGHLNVDGSAANVNVSGDIRLEEKGTLTLASGTITTKTLNTTLGTFNFTGGTLNIDGGHFVPAEGSFSLTGSDTKLKFYNNASATFDDKLHIATAENDNCNVTQTDSNITVQNHMYVSDHNNATATYTLTNGSLNSSLVAVGAKGTGTFTNDSAIHNMTSNLYAGTYANSNGTYNITGFNCELNTKSIYLGNDGVGSLNISGGITTVQNDVHLGLHAPGTGNIKTMGGQLNVAGKIYVGEAGTGTLNWANGLITTPEIVIGEHGTFNYYRGAYDLISDIKLSGSGTFVKKGTRKLTLTNNLALTGDIFVKYGILKLTGDNKNMTSDITIESKGELHIGEDNSLGDQTNVHMQSEDSILHIDNIERFGSFSGIGKLNLNGHKIIVGVNNRDTTFSGYIHSFGSIEKRGTGTLTLSGGHIRYDGDTIISNGTLDLTGNSSYMTGDIIVKSGATLRAGINDSLSAHSNIDINAGAELHFDDSETFGSFSGSGNVDIHNHNIRVGENNRDTVYAGDIRGTGKLTKLGTGTLTLSGRSTYSGETAITAGTIIVDHNEALGTGKLSLKSATIFITDSTKLEVTDFSSFEDSVLTFELNDASHASLTTTGFTSFNGILDIRLSNGYTPALGSSFDILNWTNASTTQFNQLLLPILTPDLYWDTTSLYSDGTITVAAVPEPASILLFSIISLVSLCRTRLNFCPKF